MPKHSKQHSDRQDHISLSGGKDYCVICGAHEKLTVDHVPPKIATRFREIAQYHISETYNPNPGERVCGVRSNNGAKFKTICKGCNSLLGRYDNKLGDLCKSVSEFAHTYFAIPTNWYNIHTFKCDIEPVMRSVTGHIISATTTKECEEPPKKSEFWTPLRRFVIEGVNPSNTHDFYCWYYPFNETMNGKNVGFQNKGHQAIVSVLSFYPIAFLVVQKGQGIFPGHAHKINFEANSISLNFHPLGFEMARFPFHNLKGNQLALFIDQMCIASIPVES